MNILSLFDGISTGMLALKEIGIDVDNYFSSEVDENAIEISKHNHDNIIYLGDITKWKEWELPKIDLILAGSPCQGFSRNGNHLNFKHKESKLFFEFVDILNHIKENNNENVMFLLENVAMKKEWEEIISEYVGVESICINSKLLSAQNRKRLYWTNIPNVKMPKDKNIKLSDILENVKLTNLNINNGVKFDSKIRSDETEIVNVVDGELRIKQAVKKGYIVAKDGDGINLSFPKSKTRRGRVTKEKSATLDTSCNLCVYKDGIIRKLTITEIERLQTLPDGYTNVDGISETERKKAIGNGWTTSVIVHILSNLKEVL